MIQIETYMQIIIEVQDAEPHDVAIELHEEQVIEVLGEVEVLETHVEAEDNLSEVVLPLDQVFYMVLDPHQYHHQDIHLIQEDHKALEVAAHSHQAPPGGGAPPPPNQGGPQGPGGGGGGPPQGSPSIGPGGGPPGPPGGLGNNPPNSPGPGGNPGGGGGGGSGGGGGGSGGGGGDGPGPAPLTLR